jgi:hypothetical protein
MADIETIFGKGGAMEALLQAHDQKLVRYLGLTVHYANCVKPYARRLPAKASLVEKQSLFPPVPCRLTFLFWLSTAARNISAISVCENRSPGQKARIK